jgi:DNA-binding transcriptional regulator YdaS (Cro superfamily)
VLASDPVKTKLSAYLRRTKISHRALAEKAGIPHLHPMISQWAKAERWPGLAAAVGIERATGGKIPASYWLDLKRRVEAAKLGSEHTGEGQ